MPPEEAESSSGKPAKVDPKSYNQVVSHATIADVRLVATKFDLKPDVDIAANPAWQFKLSDQLEDWTCDNEKGELSGIFTYTASCVDGRKKLLTITCRYISVYRLSDLCDEEAGRQFLARVGRFSAYPYFRSIFATLTQQSGMLLPPLPVISDGPRWVNPPTSPGESAAAGREGRTKNAKPAGARNKKDGGD
ncbi:hypothetical protein A3718_05520 [Erythrobacter sp. HI0019]|uniref:hypothetical protein n=1 Tax=unclassified Erythrobacter TaxID=2633097 RepID=UPI0007BA53E5|nr:MULTISPECIES: hypothetical protein [unclassified Erythrobacter]KZX85967.1 hypothetical protein A3718_05520 [Erythrobacter sp. HI0019]KZY07649.1 hypothetical protein A3723_02625 [Erythrobacter sp. HI0028]